ncbi:MAG: hypothetical protein U0441_22450 [Polyangiaceae bacterium]
MGQRGFRGGGRKQAGNSSTGCGVALAVAVGGAFVLTAVVAIVRGIIAAFSTPYPWIVIALGGLGFGAYKLAGRVALERTEARFWIALAAVGDASPDAGAAVGAMLRASAPSGDPWLVAAAHAAADHRNDDAIDAIDRARPFAQTLGLACGALCLRFPGLPGAITFAPSPLNYVLTDIVRGHLLNRLGRSKEVLAMPAPSPNDLRLELRLMVLGDALHETGQFDAAVRAYTDAARFAGTAPEGADIRYRLARALENAGQQANAASVYQSLGEHEDAEQRARQLAHVLEAAQEAARAQATELQRRTREQEQARAAERARLAEEAHRAEEQERRSAIVRAEEEALRQAMDKLRAAKGAAGRRAAVERALDAIADPGRRESVLVEASRLEVLAVLDKVDGLKTPAAKRRHLAAALEAIRNDDVRDELQAEQIRWLEKALAEVES